jgi:UDP-N-acetylglucosamine--dolichyl-phosphate N-acetylglucosaminephosphotransferase
MSFEISNPIILFSIIASFILTLLALPYWIRRAKNAELIGKDVHKLDKREIAEMGGIIVVFGFLFAVLFYIAIDTFYLQHSKIESFLIRDLQLMAALLTIMIIAIIGMVDDILGWKIGLRQWQKPILVALASVPIMVVNAGHSIIFLPYFGEISIGIIYPLLIIPIAISGAANGFNMLAGYNGLETGMGAIILAALGYIAWITNSGSVAVMALCMVFALLAFYIYNKYPAKVFPGDTLTYTVGGLIAIIAILGNMEKIALILFIPYFIEFLLKLRGKFRKESFAKLNEDGSIELPYKKFYGLEHVAISIMKKIKRKVYEKDVVYCLFTIQLLIVFIAFIIRG